MYLELGSTHISWEALIGGVRSTEWNSGVQSQAKKDGQGFRSVIRGKEYWKQRRGGGGWAVQNEIYQWQCRLVGASMIEEIPSHATEGTNGRILRVLSEKCHHLTATINPRPGQHLWVLCIATALGFASNNLPPYIRYLLWCWRVELYDQNIWLESSVGVCAVTANQDREDWLV